MRYCSNVVGLDANQFYKNRKGETSISTRGCDDGSALLWMMMTLAIQKKWQKIHDPSNTLRIID